MPEDHRYQIMSNMAEEERVILELLSSTPEYCHSFRGIAKRTEVAENMIPHVVRLMKERGLVRFQRGLFREDDGSAAGSGYGPTELGIEISKLWTLPLEVDQEFEPTKIILVQRNDGWYWREEDKELLSDEELSNPTDETLDILEGNLEGPFGSREIAEQRAESWHPTAVYEDVRDERTF